MRFILLMNVNTFVTVFSVYKLVKSLRDREIARDEKKKLKQQRKEKENAKKLKKK